MALRVSSERDQADYKARQFRRGIAAMESGDMLTVEQAKQALGMERAGDE